MVSVVLFVIGLNMKISGLRGYLMAYLQFVIICL